MIKKLLLATALLCAPLASATTVTLIGTLASSTGNPVNGRLCVSLPVNAIDTSTNTALSPLATCFPLTNGTLPAFAKVVPNDVIQPSNTYYQAKAYDTTGRLVYFANWSIPTGGGTFNMGQALPTTITTTNVSYVNPALLNVANVWTATQTFPDASILVQKLAPGTNGQFLTVTGGVATWGAGGGTTVSVNGTGVGSSVNFGNLPAAGANNILGVWQFSAGNASVEVPATGNGAKVISGTGTYNNGHSVVIDASGNVVDSGAASLFIQRVTLVGGCTASGANSYNSCTNIITWPVAFADNSYTVTASCVDANVSQALQPNSEALATTIASHTASQVVVTTQTQRTISATCSEIHVIGAR